MRLIDADELKKKSFRDEWNNMVVEVEEIDNAPTVKTYCYFCGQTEHGQIEERPQGVWIYQDYNFICSNCCKPALELEDYPYLSEYCPFCGTEMEIEK